jgi:hypothetical protein
VKEGERERERERTKRRKREREKIKKFKKWRGRRHICNKGEGHTKR